MSFFCLFVLIQNLGRGGTQHRKHDFIPHAQLQLPRVESGNSEEHEHRQLSTELDEATERGAPPPSELAQHQDLSPPLLPISAPRPPSL